MAMSYKSMQSNLIQILFAQFLLLIRPGVPGYRPPPSPLHHTLMHPNPMLSNSLQSNLIKILFINFLLLTRPLRPSRPAYPIALSSSPHASSPAPLSMSNSIQSNPTQSNLIQFFVFFFCSGLDIPGDRSPPPSYHHPLMHHYQLLLLCPIKPIQSNPIKSNLIQ